MCKEERATIVRITNQLEKLDGLIAIRHIKGLKVCEKTWLKYDRLSKALRVLQGEN